MDLKKRDPGGFPAVKQLTSDPAIEEGPVFEGGPHWSPDGKKIIFGRSEAAGRQQLWVMDLEDLDAARVPGRDAADLWPGYQVVCDLGRDQGGEPAKIRTRSRVE